LNIKRQEVQYYLITEKHRRAKGRKSVYFVHVNIYSGVLKISSAAEI